jgi:hypothetical protein
MGATGVEVNGASYDVAFLDGSCNSLYNGCTGLPFTTSSEALAASQALLDQVMIPQGISANNHYLINGIGDVSNNILGDVSNNILGGAFILTPAAESWGTLLALGISGSFNWLPYNNATYTAEFSSITSPYLYSGVIPSDEVLAVWTPAAVSAVPLPAAAWLFISAIAGLAGAKRLSRSKGSA